MLTGDEALHYYITEDGMPLVKEANGDFCYATFSGDTFVSTKCLAHNGAVRSAAEKAMLSSLDFTAIEDGIAKMRKEGFVLAYENSAIVIVREENATDATVYPSLYGVSNPPSVLSYSPNSYTTELKTISITFSEAVRIEGITSSDQFPIYNAEDSTFPVGMGNWTLSGETLTIELESGISTNGDYYIVIPAECIISEITGKKSAEDIKINLVVYNEEQTSIEEVNGESGKMEVIYDLTGRKIETVTKGGIYIVNGKKILVK
jgi:hypothetical protein